MHEAKSSLSRLVEAVEAGEEVVLARNGRPVARLVAWVDAPASRRLGVAEGFFSDLEPDEALNDEVRSLFVSDDR